MATLEFKPPQSAEREPELNLLLPKGQGQEQSLWSSLRQNFKDTFFPEKLPPLVLTSKPVPVRDIWGFYNYRKSSATLSMLAHIVGLAGILALSYYFGKPVIQAAKRQVVEIVAPSEVPTMKPAKTQVGGGGGVGAGPGVGEGHGGGIGGGVFHVGGGVSAPKAVFSPDPEYSEEARKAKYQGVCVLSLIVGPDGKPRDIKLSRSLGLGLDEKAIQAVNQWKFEPALKDGKPVAVAINVEVQFRLY